MAPDEDCRYVDTEGVRPPEGVLGIHIVDEDALEISFDPDRISDSQVADYARHLAPPRLERCLFRLQGRACEACALKIEDRTAALPGVRKASATFLGGTMSVAFDGAVTDQQKLLQKVREVGAPAVPWTPEVETADRVEMAFTAVTLLAILIAWVFPAATTPAMLVAYVTGGSFGVMAAWESLKQKTIDVDLLMILAALGAAYIGAPLEGAVLLFLFSLSNVLQGFAIEQTRKAIHSLMKLRPEKALTRREGSLRLLPIDELVIGDLVTVRPGEAVPLDGIVRGGGTNIDESSLTGESLPVQKGPGDPVFAGTINGTGGFEFEVTRLAKDSTVARLVQMVEEAQSEKAKTQRWLDRAEQYYAVGVILFTLTLIAVPVAFGAPFDSTFYRAITVMVVASPCALIISTPATILSAIGGAARKGVLFKGGAHLERAGGIDAIAFDKTGTLTIGKPRVTDLKGHGDENELLRLAAAVETGSEHPLAQAIVAEARARGLQIPEAFDFESISGKGASATVLGRRLSIGSPRMLSDHPDGDAYSDKVQALQRQGKTVMLLADEETVLGILAVADVVREDAAATVAALRELGFKRLVMVTGDNRLVAEAIAAEVGIDEVHADLLPQDKVTILQELKTSHKVAMVGDGVNDAPALATADLGIAMGGAGTDVALESADVVFMGERLGLLPFAFGLSRRARRVVLANLSFALSVIVILVIASLLGDLALPLGVLGHEGSTVLVCLNGLRLLFHRQEP